MFDRIWALGAAASNVIAAVKEFICQLTVMTTLQPGQPPVADRAGTALSATHGVTSAAEAAKRAIPLMSTATKPEPTTVTLKAPETGMFETVTELGAAASILRAAVNEFICQPVVITKDRESGVAAPAFKAMALSARHVVALLADPCTRDCKE